MFADKYKIERDTFPENFLILCNSRGPIRGADFGVNLDCSVDAGYK